MGFSLSKLPMGQIMACAFLVMMFGMVGIGKHILDQRPSMGAVMAQLPTLRGEGDLPHLHQVMEKDSVLEQMVKNLASVPAEELFLMTREIDPAIIDILFRWAGVSQVQPDAYGPYIDGRVVAFMERAGAISKGTLTPQTQISAEDAVRYNRMWMNAFNHFRMRLLAQTAGRAVYNGQIEYRLSNSTVVASGLISKDFIDRFKAGLQTSRNSAEAMRNFLDFVDATKGFDNLTADEQDMIMSLEQNSRQ